MIGDVRRMTKTREAVLRFLLADPAAERYGLEIMEATGLSSGTMYPMLAEFERTLQWLDSREEDIDPRTEHRAARRFYRLNPDGIAKARLALARATADKPFRRSAGALIPKNAL